MNRQHLKWLYEKLPGLVSSESLPEEVACAGI